MSDEYRLVEGQRLDTESHDVVRINVVPDRDLGIGFQCPCGLRTVYVTQPPHEIQFDDVGRLTLVGSVGFRARGEYPANWCHFDMTGGKATMYSDAKCPGSEANRPG